MPLTGKPFIVIDAGSHALKAIVCEPHTDALPRILNKFVVHTAGNVSSARTMTRLRDLLLHITHTTGIHPSKVVLGVNSSLANTKLETWTARVNPPKSFLRKEITSQFYTLFEAHRDSQHGMIAYPLALLANGYMASPDFFPHTFVQELGFHVALLTLPNEADQLFGEIKQNMGHVPFEVIPLAVAYQEALVKSLHMSDTLLIDVGGQETTVALLKNGLLAYITSFNIGTHHFLRGVARVTARPLAEIEQSAQQYMRQNSNSALQTRIHDFSIKESQEWMRAFLEQLDANYTIGPLPPSVLLTGDGAAIPEITDQLTQSNWLGRVSYAENPHVTIFDPLAFFQGNTLGGNIAGPEDGGLASLIIYTRTRTPLL